LTRHHWGEVIDAASAGVNALGHIPEETIEVLQERGVSTAGLYSKGILESEIDGFQLIIDLAAYPFEDNLPPSFKGKLLHWHVRDPYFESLDAFRQTRDTIDWLVTEKLPRWIDGE
jgi:protein-tyrosine-phosphatase